MNYYKAFLDKLHAMKCHYVLCFCCLSWIQYELDCNSEDDEDSDKDLDIYIELPGNVNKKDPPKVIPTPPTRATVTDHRIEYNPYRFSLPSIDLPLHE